MPHRNLGLLNMAAGQLRPLLSEIVFVGGCATGLLIDDPGAAPVRATFDVDVIAEIGSYAEYTVFSQRLRALGFKDDASEGAPLCRWKQGDLNLDVMPLDPAVLGFSNRWYPAALRTAIQTQLQKEIVIRTITAPYFLGTKLEAFRNRGKNDYLASHDLEDFVTVVDGRSLLAAEVETASRDLRAYVAETVNTLLGQPRFLDALPGYLLPDKASQARIGMLLKKLQSLSLLR